MARVFFGHGEISYRKGNQNLGYRKYASSINMLEIIIVHALFNSCLLLCLRKWGVLDYYEAMRAEWMPSATCNLCLGFWLCLLTILPVMWLAQWHAHWILAPFCAAAIVNFLNKP
jgi:hypothetical protein